MPLRRQGDSTEVDQLRVLAMQGDPGGQYKLAECLLTGRDVRDRLEEALKLLKYTQPPHAAGPHTTVRSAAEQDHPLAQYRLATLLAQGAPSGNQDHKAACKWYRKAAEQVGLPAALELFVTAGSQGVAKAQYRLGHCFIKVLSSE